MFLRDLASLQDACTGGEGMVGMSLRMVFNGLLDAVGLCSFVFLICAVAYMEDVVDSYTLYGVNCHFIGEAQSCQCGSDLAARSWQVGDISAERGE